LQSTSLVIAFHFTFFVLTQKKITKKSQASNEYSPLLASSFIEFLCIVVSALVILFLALLQSKYKSGVVDLEHY
jgi:hypothetical protein